MTDIAGPSAAPEESPEADRADAPGDRLSIGVAKEADAGERRVALVPDWAARLVTSGLQVLVESGAGAGAWFGDDAYAVAGARVVTTDELYATADVLLSVGRPARDSFPRLRPGQTVIGMLQPLIDPGYAAALAERGVTAVSLDGLPRTLSRAQAMDALSSQASVAGYKAVLEAANAFGRYFPLLMTAAGTAKPAEVLVLGAGVAGLQAIGTARRLGAVVRGYDVRPETKEQIASLGARFVELKSVAAGSGEGGYARALTPEEQQALQDELNGHIAQHDIVITTAQVPGRRPPVLVTEAAVRAMRAGSVIIDMAASALGGNVELSRPGETVVTENGVTVIGAENLPSTMPTGASAAYAHNICSLLLHMIRDGQLVIDLEDEIQAGVVVAYEGKIVHKPTAELLEAQSANGGATGAHGATH